MYMSKTLGNSIGTKLALVFILVLATFTFVDLQKLVAQGACSDLPSTYGRADKTVSLDSSGAYNVWTRVKATDGNVSFKLSAEGAGGATCDITLSGSGAQNDWFWIKSPTTLNSTAAGSVEVQLSGTKSGVGVDCVVLTKDTGFAPSGILDCKQPPDTTNPTVNITSPTSGESVKSNVQITANAVDNVGISSVTFYVDNVQISSPDIDSPYEVQLNTLSLSDGEHIIKAIARDTSSNSSTSETVTITVDNQPFPPEVDDLQSWWKFDENVGTSSFDTVGANNGTLANGATWSTGVKGSAVDVSGNGARVQLGTTNFNQTGFSISGWINPDTFPGDPRIISKATGTAEKDHTVMVSIVNSSGYNNLLRFRLKTGGSTTTLIADSGSVPSNSWSHFAATYDGSAMKLYLDGEEVGSIAKTGNVDSNSDATWIGGNPSGSNYFDGQIDDLQIYKTALDPLQVLSLANGVEPTGATEDTTSPQVDFTSPENNSTVDGTVALEVNASDNIGVTKVSYFLDGSTTPFSTDTSSPYSYSWNTASTENGSHTITAKAFDLAGNESSSELLVNVQNVIPDTTNPITNVTSPVNDTDVSGVIIINAEASDDVGVSRVELLIDGVVSATDVTSPYSFSWNTENRPDGRYAIRTRAFDSAGNRTQSSTVIVNVTNTPEPTPTPEPTVTGDVNGDGKVNIRDISIMLTNWRKTSATRAQGDVNGDGKVNIFDLSVILTQWFRLR
jgi:hypothetical protein